MLPGDEQPDPALATYATLEEEAAFRLWRYCVEGGPDNARNFLLYAASLLGHESDWQEPRPLLRAGLYWPGRARPALDDLRAAWKTAAPVAAVVFSRALLPAGKKIGRAHVRTPVTNAQLVCRPLLDKKHNTNTKQRHDI